MGKKDKLAQKKFDPEAVVPGDTPKPLGKVMTIPLASVVIHDEFNSREKLDFEAQDFVELRESIRREGLLMPVRVSPQENEDGEVVYDLIAGFRRTYACKQLGHTEILACVEHYETMEDALVANIVENTLRQNLRPYELAAACQRLKKAGLAVKDIAARIQRSESHIGNLTRCMEKLPKEILLAFKHNDSAASVNDYVRLSGLETPEQIRDAWAVLTGPVRPADDGGKKNKDAEPEGKKFKCQKGDAIDRFIAEIKQAEGIMIKGEQYEITEDMVNAMTTALRWARGRIKHYPLVMAPEDET